jgi:hypothetical protein
LLINNKKDKKEEKMKNITTPFVPVKGTEEKIKQLSPTEGYLYFATDTKKIFIDDNNKKLSLCDNTGLFYGTKEI